MNYDQYFTAIDNIQHWDVAYYQNDKPLVTDAEYDRVFAQIKDFESKNPDLILKESPTQRVSGKVSSQFKQAEHSIPMLSLYTETNTTAQGAEDFFKRISEALGTDGIDLVLEPKFDGLAIELRYEHGVFVRAATRGDGITGEDVTHTVRTIRSIPMILLDFAPELLCVRGEIVMPRKEFDRINSEILAEEGKAFANPRNAAAGTVRQLDPAVASKRKLAFYAYGVGAVEGWDNCIEIGIPTKHSEMLSLLNHLGLPVANTYNSNVYAKAATFMVQYHKSMEAKRINLPFDIDGVVYKVDRYDLQEKLGFTGREPRWAVAHKYNPEEATTTVLGIDIQVGRTGRMTPVARVKPVFVGGVVVSNCTLHNLFDVRRRNVRVKDTVIIRRAGDVIPEILPVTNKRRFYENNFRMPKQCPVCGSKVDRLKGEAIHYCTGGLNCPAQKTYRMIHFVSREALNIKGLGEKHIKSLVEKQLINDFTDFYKPGFISILETELGIKTASNLKESIEKSRTTTLTRLIYGLGIENIGLSTARDLADHFKNIDKLMSATSTDLLIVPDMGPVGSSNLTFYFEDPRNREIIQTLKTLLTIEHVEKLDSNHPLKGKTIVTTGSFTFMTRKELEEKVISLGAKLSSAVSRKTDYLFAGTGGGEKSAIANKLNVPVVDEAGIIELLK